MVNEGLPSVMEEGADGRETEGKRSESFKKVTNSQNLESNQCLRAFFVFNKIKMFFKVCQTIMRENRRKDVEGKKDEAPRLTNLLELE